MRDIEILYHLIDLSVEYFFELVSHLFNFNFYVIDYIRYSIAIFIIKSILSSTGGFSGLIGCVTRKVSSSISNIIKHI